LGFFFFLPTVKLKFKNLPSIKTYFFILFYYLLLLLHYILLLLLLLLFLTKQAHLPGRNWVLTVSKRRLLSRFKEKLISFEALKSKKQKSRKTNLKTRLFLNEMLNMKN